MKNHRQRWAIGAILTLIGGVIAAMAALGLLPWATLSALESHKHDDERALDRIEGKLDHLDSHFHPGDRP